MKSRNIAALIVVWFFFVVLVSFAWFFTGCDDSDNFYELPDPPEDCTIGVICDDEDEDTDDEQTQI